jgi:hypothetical protein
MMSDADEVRLLEIATKLVTDWLGCAPTSSIVAFGVSIGEMTRQCDTVEEIRAVGELLESLTTTDRQAIERGERWSKRSRRLTVPEARRVLRGMSIDQMEAFAERWGYCIHEVLQWSLEQRDIHGGALVALGDVDEMAKIMGETR